MLTPYCLDCLLNNRCNSGLFQFRLSIFMLFLRSSVTNRRRTLKNMSSTLNAFIFVLYGTGLAEVCLNSCKCASAFNAMITFTADTAHTAKIRHRFRKWSSADDAFFIVAAASAHVTEFCVCTHSCSPYVNELRFVF